MCVFDSFLSVKSIGIAIRLSIGSLVYKNVFRLWFPSPKESVAIWILTSCESPTGIEPEEGIIEMNPEVVSGFCDRMLVPEIEKLSIVKLS